ncbi:MAG: radical SAM/SPASM domain-containing protein [Lentimicrobium sp.]
MNKRIEQNSKLNYQEYKNKQIFLESYPQYVMVELTRSCNLKCPMCRVTNKEYAEHNMSMDVFNKIEKELFDKAKMIDLRGWGESLILDNIIEIIERVARKGPMIRFVSNLSFINDDVLEVLAKFNCKIDVSLDSADASVLSQLRGGAKLNIIERNLKLLTKLYKKYQGNNDNLSVIATVQCLGLNIIHELIPFVSEQEIKEIRLFPVDITSDSILSLEKNEVEVNAMLKLVKSLSHEYDIQVIVGAKMGCLPLNGLNIPVCIHPWTYCYIAYNGKIGFCDHLIGPSYDNILIGDLLSNSFKEIWNNIYWQNLRKDHLFKKENLIQNYSQCSWCYQNKYIDFEDIFDNKIIKKQLRDFIV